MAMNISQLFSKTKKILFPATSVILMYSFLLQALIVEQSILASNEASSKAEVAKTESLGLVGPVVAHPMADCSSQAALRREISNRWRFFAQPIPPYLPGIGIPGINRKSRKAYEELYWSARMLEEIGKQLIREARKETDKNMLSSACLLLNKELQVQNLITTTDADANNLWYGFLNDTYQSVKKIRDLCINILEIGGILVTGGIPLLVLGILNSLFKEITDNALFQSSLPPETYARIVIFDIIIPVLLEIKVSKWGNKTFSEYVTKKVTLPTLVNNPPGFVKLIKEALRAFRGGLKPALERKAITALAGYITNYQIYVLTDRLNSRLEQYMDENTSSQQFQSPLLSSEESNVANDSSLMVLEVAPVETATEVNVLMPTITVRFSETIQNVNLQAQLFHQNGSMVTLNSGIIGDTLFFNLGSSLQPNTSYTMRLQAGSIRGIESTSLNQSLEWTFVTDTTSLANGSLVLVTNTGGVGLRLRNNPSTNAGIISTLSEGTRLTVTGNSFQSSGYTWYPVQTQNGQNGWSATGNWLIAVDQYGFRQGSEVQVANTSGVGLRLRIDAGETSPIITVLPEGSIVKLTGEPVFADGYSWFPVQISDATQGYCAIAPWLIPYSQSGASNLVIRTVATSTTDKLDWGQSTTYDFYVTDGNGLPVSGASISGQNGLVGSIFLAPNPTDTNGRTSYVTAVPSGRANGVYSIVASATRSGFSTSLSVTRNVEVSHGCTYQIIATDSTFPWSGGTGSFSIITQPACSWSVSSQNPEFINLTSSGIGTGDGEVTFSVSQNSSASSRTGNLVVGGTNVAVRQEGGPANIHVSVGTDPDGLSFTVDGQAYISRQSFAWAYGSSHTIGTSSSQTIGVDQFNFASWSDAGAQFHSVTANTNQTLTARFDLPANTNVALDYSWQTRATSIVHGWGATATAPGDGFLYVLGGSQNSTKFSRFDPVSNTWTQLPAINGGTLEGASAALAGKIYVYGNYSTTGMSVYDLASGQWLSNKTGPYSVPVRGSSFIVIGGELYAVGGANLNLDPMSGLKKYNPNNDTWIQLADMPTPRAAGATALVDGRIYVAGGNASGNAITSVNIYDPQSNTWLIGTPLPQTRIQATAIAVNSRIMIIGGSNGTVETRTVFEYNPISDVWRELSQFNQGRYGAVGAFMRGKLYVIGGEDATNHTAFANLEEGTPSAWAPTLSFGQPVNPISGNRLGFINLSISNPPNIHTPLTLTSSDPSKISFPFTYSFSQGQTSAQITYRTGYAGGPVTIFAELPDNLARVRAYTQITVTPGLAGAETQDVTDITSNSALLNGTVNPAGSSTNAFFEWGTDANLSNPQTTAQVNAGDGLTSVTAALPIVNLQSGVTYYFRMAATNAAGTSRGAIQSFTTPSVNSPPTINAFSVTQQQGSPSSISTIANVSDSDQAVNTLIVTVNGGASATVNGVTVSGISISVAGAVTANVVASCTATNASFALTVTDNAAASANATLNVTAIANSAPTLTYGNQSVAAGGSLIVNPASGPTDNGSISSLGVLSQGTFTGMVTSVNTSTGAISISGAAPIGTHTFTVRTTDDCGTITDASFPLTVNCSSTITLNPTTLPGGTTGANYNQTITASGGTPGYGFTVIAGALPSGLNLSTGGVLSGTPVAANTYPFTIRATDTSGCTGTQTYTITIQPSPNCPGVTNSNPSVGPIGATVVLTGTNFTGVTAIKFSNNLSAAFTINSVTQITAIVPAGAVTGPITISNSGCPDVQTAVFTVSPCIAASISDSLSGAQGSSLTVPISVSDLTGGGIVSYDFTLMFDTSVLSLQATPVDAAGTLSSGMTVTPNTTMPGKITISAFGITPLSGSGTLLNLKFNVAGSSPPGACTDLVLVSFRFNEGTPCSTPSNGRFCVTNTFSISGVVSYCIATAKKISGVVLTTNGAPPLSGTSNNTGSYIINNIPAGPFTVTPAKTGDVNGISSFDASQAAQAAAGLTTLNSCQLVAADGSNNGSVSSFDASLIAQFAAGLPVTPPSIVGTWKFVPSNRMYNLSGNLTNENYDAVLVGDVSGNWTPPAGLPSPINPGRPRVQAPISLPTTSAATGANVTIPVTVGSLTGLGITSYDFTFNFNPAILQLQNPAFDATSTLSNGLTITPNPNTPGQLKISAFGVSALSDVGTLLNLNFTAVGTAGTSTALTLSSFIFNEDVQDNITNGNFSVGQTCPTITVSPLNPILAVGTQGTPYSQLFTQTGSAATITWTNPDGGLPAGLSLDNSSGLLIGTPTAPGMFTFTIKATDSNGCPGSRTYNLQINPNGLQFYPLPSPVRLLDTRSSATNGCVKNTGPFANAETRMQAARITCSTVPANATAIVGNITVVPSGPGFLTLFPSDAAQPTVASSNFKAGEVTNNFFTVGLGAADGAFKIFTSLFNAGTNSEVIIDVTGYYAPPGAGGLYYHPLPSPVRLVQTFPGQTGCFANPTVTQLQGTNDPNANPALDLLVDGRGPGLPSPCNGIPNDAAVLVGNATTVFPSAPFGFGYLTIYPSDATRPTVASSNYGNNDIINGPFAVKLGADGKFKVYTFSTTHLVIDISGYYSASPTDVNGTGLLFNPLPKPMRLLETRNIPGFPLTGCYQPQAPIAGGTGGIRTQPVWGTCSDQPITIPNSSRAIVGNVTAINPVNAGFGTFFPGDVGTAPTVATTNYPFPVVFGYNRHYYVGLSPTDGMFKILTQFTSDYIVDVSGYFAP